jgi:hypothetical protein
MNLQANPNVLCYKAHVLQSSEGIHMNNLVSLALLAISGPTFAWGDFSPYTNGPNAYCTVKRSTGSVRNGVANVYTQIGVTICGPTNCATGSSSSYAVATNITGNSKGADLWLKSRRYSGAVGPSLQGFNVTTTPNGFLNAIFLDILGKADLAACAIQ